MRTIEELKDPSCDVGALTEAVESQEPPRWRAVAQNPNAPAEILKRITQRSDPETIHYVARNPNISFELLLGLLEREPAAIQENPSASLWLLEDPVFVRRFSPGVVGALLRFKELSPAIVRALVPNCNSYYSNLLALLEHPNAPFDLFMELLHKVRNHRAMRAFRAAKNPNLPASLVHYLLGDRAEQTRRLASQHPNLDPRFFSLAKRLGWTSTGQGEIDISLTQDELILLSSGGPYLRSLVARHPNANDFTFARIGVGVNDPILRDIAQHPNTTADVLVDLVVRRGTLFSSLIAARADLSMELKRLLAIHGGAQTHLILLRKEQLPAECFDAFVQRGSVAIRAAAAGHRELPAHLAQRLAFDRSELVRSALARRGALSRLIFERLARDKNAHVRGLIASHPEAPADILAKLANDPNKQARPAPSRGVSAAPAPYAALLALFREVPEEERLRLALLPGVHPILAAHLSGGEEVLATESAEEGDRAALLKRLQSPDAPAHLLERLMPSKDPLVRRAILRHQNAPLVLLVSAALYARPGELFAMSKNPSLHAVLRAYLMTKQIPRRA